MGCPFAQNPTITLLTISPFFLLSCPTFHRSSCSFIGRKNRLCCAELLNEYVPTCWFLIFKTILFGFEHRPPGPVGSAQCNREANESCIACQQTLLINGKKIKRNRCKRNRFSNPQSQHTGVNSCDNAENKSVVERDQSLLLDRSSVLIYGIPLGLSIEYQLFFFLPATGSAGSPATKCKY